MGVAPFERMCHVEYYVPPCARETNPRCEHVFNNSWAMPFPGEIVGSFAHFHAGALNMSTFTKDGLVCTSAPSYDAKGRITNIPHCQQGEPCTAAACGKLPAPLAKGDKINVEMIYAQDSKPHYGVMGFSVLMIHRTDYDN